MISARIARIAAFGIVAALVGSQFVTTKRTNPPSVGTLTAPAQVEVILKRACYDCHSNQTRWPWYSNVAPLSWLIVHDVTLGRKEVNFSRWGTYYQATRLRKLEWMGRAVREERMPPWSYRLMHPDARLTNADRAALERWIKSGLTASDQKQS